MNSEDNTFATWRGTLSGPPQQTLGGPPAQQTVGVGYPFTETFITHPAGGMGSSGTSLGLGEATTTTTTTGTNYLPWIIGGVAAVALGGLGYYAYKKSSYAMENPTRKQSIGQYRASVANLLMHRYGFSFAKINASFTDPEIEGGLEGLFRRRRTVEYAALSIHRRVRRKFYKPWKKAGYMPLRMDLPPAYNETPFQYAEL